MTARRTQRFAGKTSGIGYAKTAMAGFVMCACSAAHNQALKEPAATPLSAEAPRPVSNSHLSSSHVESEADGYPHDATTGASDAAGVTHPKESPAVAPDSGAPAVFPAAPESTTHDAASAVESNPEPPASFFPDREQVSYSEFIEALRGIADELANDPDVIDAHQVLLQDKELSAAELPLQSFSRARLAFESARDSGLWGIRGTVTDQMPWSDRIWAQWAKREFTPEAPIANEDGKAYPTAYAECDELAALFSILARDLGVVGFVGLHWPTWNHTVPIWQVPREHQERPGAPFVRILVPATQTFLDREATIGTTGLPTNRVVFPYVRKDRKDAAVLEADLVRFLLTQSQRFGGLSTAALTRRRLWSRWNYRPQAQET